MFNFIKRYLYRDIVEPDIVTYGWGVHNLDQEFLLNEIPESSVPDSGIFKSVGRDYGDTLQACQMKGCVRPSTVTLMSDAELSVDIPNATRSRMDLNESKLPIFRLYLLCDRCYRDFVRAGYKAAYVFSDKPVYNPDKDKSTQIKLARSV